MTKEISPQIEPANHQNLEKKPSRKLIVGIGSFLSCLCVVGIICTCVIVFSSSGSSERTPIESSPELSLYQDDEYPITIASDEYFKGQKAEDFVTETMWDRDPDMLKTLRYAESESYIPSVEEAEILSAARITLGDGKVYDLFQLGTGPSPEESIIVLQGGHRMTEFEQAVTFFLRLEDYENDPKLIMYHPDGTIEMKNDDLEIISVSNVEQISITSQSNGLMSPIQADACVTSMWQDYTNCVSSYMGAGYTAGCVAAMASLKAGAAAAGRA